MDRTRQRSGSRAKHARHVVKFDCDSGKPGLGEADGDREESNDVGNDESGRGARQQEADPLAGGRPTQSIECIVHQNER